MSRPRLLDLFCCQGGAAMGYHRAGFDVVGVDIVAQPRYPFEFVQADALEYVAEHGSEFDAIHASPPCQAHSTITPDKSKHVDLIPPTRDILSTLRTPWVIENVEGARHALHSPMRLCGSSFGLAVRRHRYFESNIWLTSLPCRHADQAEVFGVYGDHPEDSHLYRHSDGSSRGMRARSIEHARDLMGMPWADWHGCSQAIPPAYCEFIGRQLLAELARDGSSPDYKPGIDVCRSRSRGSRRSTDALSGIQSSERSILRVSAANGGCSRD